MLTSRDRYIEPMCQNIYWYMITNDHRAKPTPNPVDKYWIFHPRSWLCIVFMASRGLIRGTVWKFDDSFSELFCEQRMTASLCKTFTLLGSRTVFPFSSQSHTARYNIRNNERSMDLISIRLINNQLWNSNFCPGFECAILYRKIETNTSNWFLFFF